MEAYAAVKLIVKSSIFQRATLMLKLAFLTRKRASVQVSLHWSNLTEEVLKHVTWDQIGYRTLRRTHVLLGQNFIPIRIQESLR